MSYLTVTLFGSMHTCNPTGELKIVPTAQTLLAYLLLHRQRSHHRSALLGLFWPNVSEERARHSLNTTLWRLRCILEPEPSQRGKYLVSTPGGEVGINPESTIILDVAQFEAAVHAVLSAPVDTLSPALVARLEDALALYTDDLLKNCYEDWALRERERLRFLYLRSLAHLMHYYAARQQIDAAVAHGQHILRLDPLREDVHRALMRLYQQNGQRALAVQQYEQCRQVLEEELQIGPMPETRALYAQLLPDLAPALPNTPLAVQSDDTHMLHLLHNTLHVLEAACAQMHTAIDAMSRSASDSPSHPAP